MSTRVLANPRLTSGSKRVGIALLMAYAVVYSATLHAMVRFAQFDAGDALGILAVLGVGFSFAAWLLTIGIEPLPYRVLEPDRELLTLILYLLPLTAFIAFRFSAIHRYVPLEPADSLAILVAKLAVFVVVPAWIMVARLDTE